MKRDGKIMFKLENVEFNKSRYRRYFGNIGEMVAEEMLLKEGFDVWLLTPYSPEESPLRKRKKLGRGGLLYYLSYLDRTPPNEKSLKKEYEKCYSGLRFYVPTRREFYEKQIKDYESKIKELRTFFGNKLKAFRQYMEEVKNVYSPDLIAKKDGNIYVTEVKTNSGAAYLKGKKLKGLMLAKKYGFIPILITLSISIKVDDLTIIELLS